MPTTPRSRIARTVAGAAVGLAASRRARRVLKLQFQLRSRLHRLQRGRRLVRRGKQRGASRAALQTPTTLTWWAWAPQDKQLVTAFEKLYPNIKTSGQLRALPRKHAISLAYTVPDTNFLAGNFSEQLGTTSVGHTTLSADPSITVRFTIRAAATPLPPAKWIPKARESLWHRPHGHTDRIHPQPDTGQHSVQHCRLRPGYRRRQAAQLLPAAQKPGNVANNLILAGAAPTYWDEYGIRVDHNINDNTNAYFRYSYKKEAKTGTAAELGIRSGRPRQSAAQQPLGHVGGALRRFSAPPSP